MRIMQYIGSDSKWRLRLNRQNYRLHIVCSEYNLMLCQIYKSSIMQSKWMQPTWKPFGMLCYVMPNIWIFCHIQSKWMQPTWKYKAKGCNQPGNLLVVKNHVQLKDAGVSWGLCHLNNHNYQLSINSMQNLNNHNYQLTHCKTSIITVSWQTIVTINPQKSQLSIINN